MASIDVFRSNFRLSHKVCILAPGPNGRGHYHEIPPDREIIAVSKGVLIREVAHKSVWVMNHCTQDWFDKANSEFHGTRVFSAEALKEARGKVNPTEDCYYYQAVVELEPDTVSLVDGAIHYGTSVAGCALQLAYNFGAREVLLCGVDMSGDGYWDGTENVHAHHGAVWPASRTINSLVRWLGEERGVRVETLSETKLNVPTYGGLPLEAT